MCAHRLVYVLLDAVLVGAVPDEPGADGPHWLEGCSPHRWRVCNFRAALASSDEAELVNVNRRIVHHRPFRAPGWTPAVDILYQHRLYAEMENQNPSSVVNPAAPPAHPKLLQKNALKKTTRKTPPLKEEKQLFFELYSGNVRPDFVTRLRASYREHAPTDEVLQLLMKKGDRPHVHQQMYEEMQRRLRELEEEGGLEFDEEEVLEEGTHAVPMLRVNEDGLVYQVTHPETDQELEDEIQCAIRELEGW